MMVAISFEHGDAAYWRAESERWRGEAERLAVEAAENAVLRARVAELEGQVAALTEKVTTLTRLLFGDSSEKQSPRSGRDDGDGGGGRPDADESAVRRRGQRPGGRGHGRRDYSGLETVEEIHDLPAEQRVCPDCGAAYVRLGEECSEQVDWL